MLAQCSFILFYSSKRLNDTDHVFFAFVHKRYPMRNYPLHRVKGIESGYCLKNSPATFQCLVNSLIFNLVGCKAYIDDAIIFSEEWEQHLQTIRNFFDRLSEATLMVNLTKSEFAMQI